MKKMCIRDRLITDERGYVCSVAIPYGSYIIRETTVPHNLTPAEDFKIVISENQTEPQVWKILVKSEFQAKLKIVKLDEDTKKSVLLSGTEFKIYDLKNEKYVEQVTSYPSTVCLLYTSNHSCQQNEISLKAKMLTERFHKKGCDVMSEEKKRLPVGVENFEQLIKDGYYYVDKKMCIRDRIMIL